jgi:hypothetical protein
LKRIFPFSSQVSLKILIGFLAFFISYVPLKAQNTKSILRELDNIVFGAFNQNLKFVADKNTRIMVQFNLQAKGGIKNLKIEGDTNHVKMVDFTKTLLAINVKGLSQKYYALKPFRFEAYQIDVSRINKFSNEAKLVKNYAQFYRQLLKINGKYLDSDSVLELDNCFYSHQVYTLEP